MQANPYAHLNAVRSVSFFKEQEQQWISYQGWDSFDRLLSGKGDMEDLSAMQSCARVLRYVCRKRPDVVAICDGAIQAGKRGKLREKAGLDGDGINDCRTVLRLFDEVLSGVAIGTLLKGLKVAEKLRKAENREERRQMRCSQ